MSSTEARPLTGRRVLAITVAFFAVIFLANGIMVWFALSSWTGIETENAYVKGLRYDQTLAQAAAQNALGWRLEHAFVGQGIGRRLRVRLRDRDGDAVSGTEISARFRRPTNEGEDTTLALAERDPGVYDADAAGLASGQWNLVILVARDGKTVFRREDRVWAQ